jgi:hypothetical protein
MSNVYNPIQSVTPCDIDGNVIGDTVTDIPAPSAFEYSLVDISASDAGRTEDLKQHKMRKGQSNRIDLTWTFSDLSRCSFILKTFNSEYALINYLDLYEGSWQEKQFYVGDRKAKLYNSPMGLVESVSFPIIQADADLITS